MFLLTLKDNKEDGAYAVQDQYGHKVLFLFEEEDDADRYAMMLEDQEEGAIETEKERAEITRRQEEEGRRKSGRKVLGNNEQVVSEGSEDRKVSGFGKNVHL